MREPGGRLPSGSRARVACASALAAPVLSRTSFTQHFIKIDHEDGMRLHLSTGQPAFSHQEPQ
jgi:hypothetical protein